MRRMRIVGVIAHTQNCEKSKTALKAIIRLITGLSTFSGRDTIVADILIVVSRTAVGG